MPWAAGGRPMAKRRDGGRPKVLIAMEAVVAGTLRHIEYLLAYTDPAEFDLHLAVSAERDPAARERFDDWRRAGRHVHEIPMCREIAPYRDAAAFGRLLALCRRERFDIVHTHCAKAGFLGRPAARISGAKTVHTPHVFPFGRGGGAAAECLYVGLERLAARWTDRIVLLSRYQLNQLLQHGLMPPERAVIIANGIEPDRYRGLNKADARKALGLGRRDPVALAVGRLCRQKGQDVLLEAAAMLREAGTALRVLMVGSGPWEARLRERVERERLGSLVTMVGEAVDLRPYYAACDLVVMPSRFEGMPYVILEAKAAGRPVAVSLVSGMGEFVRHGWDGFLIPPGNAEALARVLRRLAHDRRAFSRAGRRARAGFGPDWVARRSVKGLHGVYRSLLA